MNEKLSEYSGITKFGNSRPYKLCSNYIYLYHINKFVLLPTYPESVTDTYSASFTPTNILSRSAPIYSYSYSGPRSLQISLSLRRDMMTEINYDAGNIINFKEIGLDIDDDYVDVIIKQLQAIAVPKYEDSNRLVNPPMVALRLGNEVFIKGVVNGGINTMYSLPLLENNKYAQVTITFTISEVEPFGAEEVALQGSYKLDATIDDKILMKKNLGL